MAVRKRGQRIGMVGYVDMLAALRRPLSLAGLQRATMIGHNAARAFLGALWRQRRMHIAAWEFRRNTAPKPMFKLGPGVDAEPPTVRPDGRPSFGRPVVALPCGATPSELLLFLAVIDELAIGRSTPAEIREATGVSEKPLREIVARLREHKMLAADAWIRRHCGGRPVPIYRLGRSEDAPRPAPKTKSEINADHARRRKQTRAYALLYAMPAAANAGNVAAAA